MTRSKQQCGHTYLFANSPVRGQELVQPCLYCERDRLNTERDEAKAAHAYLGTRYVKLQDERDRYRSALEEIMGISVVGGGQIERICREALRGVEGKPSCTGCKLGLPKDENGVHRNPFNDNPYLCTAGPS